MSSVEHRNFSNERILFYQEGEDETAKILDIQGKMACVRIISEIFIDYLHFAKIDEEWMIVNVL
ncbi:MAG: nuclear transport factor 2 family protein [Candidatus Heimdallarchaeota archaeon]|nr:nuclear transport factor 2 family protein [Candidatus Heimdallarchaeota archaeon]